MNAEITEFLLPFIQKKYRKRSLLIVGAGVTGTALADLFTRYRVPFSLFDKNLNTPPLKEKLIAWKPYLQKFWNDDSLLKNELHPFTDVLLSPGFPRKDNLIITLAKQTRIWNDIDFFYPLLDNRRKTLIAITGTDGKSTTVELIKHILGSSALACGNNDIPLGQVLEKILSPEINQVVIEFSSYMLEKLYRFRADYSAILNIAPDHLDRYQNFASYAIAKHHLLLYSQPTDTYLYNHDDPKTFPHNPVSQIISYGINRRADYVYQAGKYYKGKTLVLEGKTSTVLFPGNIFPALIIARKLGLASQLIQNRLQSFPGLPHRLEMVSYTQNRTGKRLYIYNNSKATTLQSVITSIEYLYDSYKKPINIILGGRSKNTDFTPLADYRDKVKAYFYGEAGQEIQEQSRLSGKYANELERCIEEALTDLQEIPDEVLALIPGCSSFDQFSNYRERGMFFKKKVQEILS